MFASVGVYVIHTQYIKQKQDTMTVIGSRKPSTAYLISIKNK